MDESIVTFVTHNVNGFKRSKDFIRSQCETNPNSIRAIQEHWLQPPYKKQQGVNQLRHVHPNFDGYGVSAMSRSSESKVMKGRPYGGTGFIFNKKYAKCLKPLLTVNHERVSALELTTDGEKIIIINCYFPYYNQRDLENYTAMYRESIGFIDNIMHENRDSEFILLADFNCDITDSNHRYTQLIHPLMNKYSLTSVFDLDTNFDFASSYTRFDYKTNSYTLIDGILISNGLKSKVKRISISHHGDNVSDHVPVELDLELVVSESIPFKKRQPLYVNWLKLSDEQKQSFKEEMTKCLADIQIPSDEILHGQQCCLDDAHSFALERYFLDIASAVEKAESILPRSNPNIQRSFWNDELMDLKQLSIECNNHWKSLGCPRAGPVFECRQKCHYTYKSAVRKSKAEDAQKINDDLHQNLVDKNGVRFWKQWNSLNRVGNSISSRINGETDEKNIANEFASYFESVYSGSDGPAYSRLKEKFLDDFPQYYTDHIDDNILPFYATWVDMIDIAKKIEIGKASVGVFRPEHFIFGSTDLLRHFQILFNGMLQHSYIPTDFLKGVITPIVKDSRGDLTSPSNYRGITLSSLPAKLFECLIQIKTSHLLGTDDLQFGFKRQTSSSHAIYALKSTIDFFNSKGSKVYAAFLDCSKAFDRISHHGLYSILMERKFPLCILLCLIYWYSNMSCCVKWGSEFSRHFDIPIGIKQGGLNSPGYFACYMNGLTKLLREHGIGCHIIRQFLAMILFADDISLLAPSRSALQRLINLCAQYCSSMCLTFNPNKSKILVFSKSRVSLNSLKSVTINGSDIEYTNAIKYLGVSICSEKGLCFSATNDLRTFYRASNSLLSVVKKPSEEVLMNLLYTNCVPVITYACNVKDFPAKDMRDLNTAINDAIRKIFSFNRWESVRDLRDGCCLKSIYEIFAIAKQRFSHSLISHHNSIIRFLYQYASVE